MSADPTPAQGDAVRAERHGATLLLTLSRPATRNAFTPEIREGLAAGIARVRADASIRALVITGSGGHFCAGGDLRGIAAATRDPATDGATWRARMQGTQRWIHDLLTLDRPVIAAVDGAAYGAGFSLALAADVVLATPAARFCLSFMKLGLVPDCGAFHTLPRPDSGTLTRILYLADKNEPGREFLDPAERERVVALPLAEAFRLSVEAVVDWIRSEGLPLAPETADLYDSVRVSAP